MDIAAAARTRQQAGHGVEIGVTKGNGEQQGPPVMQTTGDHICRICSSVQELHHSKAKSPRTFVAREGTTTWLTILNLRVDVKSDHLTHFSWEA